MNGERGVGNFLKDNVCKEAANVASFLENNTSIYWSDHIECRMEESLQSQDTNSSLEVF